MITILRPWELCFGERSTIKFKCQPAIYLRLLDKTRNGLKSRLNLTSGVDMRSIATDQIEKVEVLRGIPSVIYGNLTSGIVKITNKSGYTRWKSRFKADGYSKLLL